MVLVGLTGGLGAGKSEALGAFERLGAATISSDAIAHEVLAEPEIRDLLVRRWGERALSGVEIDRAKVASIVFEDPGELSWLEGILFPRVGARIAEWRAGLDAGEAVPDVAVVEVPLLFEAGMEGFFDVTVALVATDRDRERWAAARGHEKVEGRLARQLPQEEKARRADWVVRNDGTLADLEQRVGEILGRLRE